MKSLTARQFSTQMGVSMRKDRYSKNLKKERIVMGVSAIFVLAALTMTGVYVKNKGTDELTDGYEMDYETLDSSMEEIESLFPTFPELDDDTNMGNASEEDLSVDDALDYAPDFEESDSLNILIPGLTKEEEDLLADEAAMAADSEKERVTSTDENAVAQGEVTQKLPDAEDSVVTEAGTEDVLADSGMEETVAEPVTPANSFVAGEALSWPISGTVLISYSMERTVYFETLQQYKYNPGIVIAAAVGDEITSASSGIITEVSEDAEIGKYVKVDMGNGYEVVYGQLQNVAAYVGLAVDVGSVLGYVAEPTKYFSAEGPNAYFALTKNGEPVDPLAPLW